MIRTCKIPTITGNATGTSPSPYNGHIVAIYVEYLITPNVATDVVISTVLSPVKTILTLTDNVTSGWYYPRMIVHSEAGVALTGTAGGDRTRHPIDDYIKVTVAQGDSDQTLDVWLLIEE